MIKQISLKMKRSVLIGLTKNCNDDSKNFVLMDLFCSTNVDGFDIGDILGFIFFYCYNSMRVEFLFSFFNIKYEFFTKVIFFEIFPLRHSDMFYMPFDSPHQDKSNGTSFFKIRYY